MYTQCMHNHISVYTYICIYFHKPTSMKRKIKKSLAIFQPATRIFSLHIFHILFLILYITCARTRFSLYPTHLHMCLPPIYLPIPTCL